MPSYSNAELQAGPSDAARYLRRKAEQLTSHDQAAQGKPEANYNELSLVRGQPRASPTATPAQSLPPTTRPARAGSLSRAGLPTRLVPLSLTMCLINVFPYDLVEIMNETDMDEENKHLKMPSPLGPLSP